MIFKPLTGLLSKSQGGIPTDGLIAYYPFNGNANDFSGNNLNATPVGSISYVTDRKGNPNSCISLDGQTSKYIYIVNNGNLLNLSTFSVCYWIYPTFFGINDWIFDHGGINGMQLRTVSTQNGAVIDFGGLSVLSAANSHILNQWDFVVWTFDGNRCECYLNNNFIAGISGITPSFSYSGNMYWSIRSNLAASTGVTALYDDIRIYNRALILTEMTALYNE